MAKHSYIPHRAEEFYTLKRSVKSTPFLHTLRWVSRAQSKIGLKSIQTSNTESRCQVPPHLQQRMQPSIYFNFPLVSQSDRLSPVISHVSLFSNDCWSFWRLSEVTVIEMVRLVTCLLIDSDVRRYLAPFPSLLSSFASAFKRSRFEYLQLQQAGKVCQSLSCLGHFLSHHG